MFCNALFQWANTLTHSGQNMPFALPQRVDPLPNGFSMAFLMSDPTGGAGSLCHFPPRSFAKQGVLSCKMCV